MALSSSSQSIFLFFIVVVLAIILVFVLIVLVILSDVNDTAKAILAGFTCVLILVFVGFFIHGSKEQKKIKNSNYGIPSAVMDSIAPSAVMDSIATSTTNDQVKREVSFWAPYVASIPFFFTPYADSVNLAQAVVYRLENYALIAGVVCLVAAAVCRARFVGIRPIYSLMIFMAIVAGLGSSILLVLFIQTSIPIEQSSKF